MAEKRPRPAAREGGFQGDGADEQPWAKSRAVGAGAGALLGVVRSRCPFLDTIDRSVLDFDLYKQCSVTLTRDNVYICLVCGSYFHGRGRNTPAFTHSLQASHHVFLNLKNEKFYCLPDNYEVQDTALDDIRRAMNPQFTREERESLDASTALRRDRQGVAYLPGFVGLNNLKCTDFINVVLQAVAHVRPLRSELLNSEALAGVSMPFVHRLSEVVRKMWSPHNFKNCVGPHEFVNEVVDASKKRFRIGHPAEAVEFFTWLLSLLNRGLPRKKAKGGKTVVHDTFQGKVSVTSRPLRVRPGASAGDAEDMEVDEGGEETKKTVPFQLLSVELPPVPLFNDAEGGNVIPQIPLFDILAKYDGSTMTDDVTTATRRTYTITRLPKYLVLHLRRFKRNNFFMEKNPTIVTFPIKNLDMAPYVDKAALERRERALPSDEAVAAMGVRELREHCTKYGIETRDVVEKGELARRVREAVHGRRAALTTKYDLVCNICHDSPADSDKDARKNPIEEGSYRCHVLARATGQWYEIQDLHVQETMPQLIGLSQSYMMVYERRDQAPALPGDGGGGGGSAEATGAA